MKQLYATFAITAVIVLTGCGGGSGSSSSKDMFKIKKVEYSLRGSNPPLCKNADEVSTSKANDNNYIGVQTCIWICGEYQGSVNSVHITFIQDKKNAAWKFSDDLVSTPPSQCYR